MIMLQDTLQFINQKGKKSNYLKKASENSCKLRLLNKLCIFVDTNTHN